MNWFKAFKTSDQKASTERKTRELLAAADRMLSETDELLSETASTIGEMRNLTPEECAWVEWFSRLPESQKTLVKACAEHGIMVTPDNFESVFAEMAKEPA